MKTLLNARILSYISFIIVFLITFWVIEFLFDDIQNMYKALISSVFSAVFSPRVIKYETQSGKKYQLKWFYSGKVINL